jgi:hypothetical protein
MSEWIVRVRVVEVPTPSYCGSVRIRPTVAQQRSV